MQRAVPQAARMDFLPGRDPQPVPACVKVIQQFVGSQSAFLP